MDLHQFLNKIAGSHCLFCNILWKSYLDYVHTMMRNIDDNTSSCCIIFKSVVAPLDQFSQLADCLVLTRFLSNNIFLAKPQDDICHADKMSICFIFPTGQNMRNIGYDRKRALRTETGFAQTQFRFLLLESEYIF